MNFVSLFAVKDITKARRFYEELFNLKVISDFGINICFDCGLALQQDFDWLVGISKDEMKAKENNCELCFEEKKFDDFLLKLKKRDDIILLHDIKEHSWGQRVIRFYDPDNHLIEVGESMKLVVERFIAQGMTVEKIAAKMETSIEEVNNMLQE